MGGRGGGGEGGGMTDLMGGMEAAFPGPLLLASTIFFYLHQRNRRPYIINMPVIIKLQPHSLSYYFLWLEVFTCAGFYTCT